MQLNIPQSYRKNGFTKKMSVLEISRKEGLEYTEGMPVYKQENVDCLVNQKRVYLKGSLYLMPEYK